MVSAQYRQATQVRSCVSGSLERRACGWDRASIGAVGLCGPGAGETLTRARPGPDPGRSLGHKFNPILALSFYGQTMRHPCYLLPAGFVVLDVKFANAVIMADAHGAAVIFERVPGPSQVRSMSIVGCRDDSERALLCTLSIVAHATMQLYGANNQVG